MNEADAYVALNMMERVGPVAVRALIEVLGSARAVFEADPASLKQASGVGVETVSAIVEQRAGVAWEREREAAEAMGVRIVTPPEEAYPSMLRSLRDAPLALYVTGDLKAGDRHAVALVGTRRPTHYGRAVAENLGFQLAKAGFTVVSGLAAGIDTAAHRGALKADGRTLAVLGGAMDCLYPPENDGLAREIAGRGAVLSEFVLGRRPDKTTFPIRNRIVSGLSAGVVVVEAAPRSGALITAARAAEQGRTVFAVPGRIDNRGALGPHGLIRDGARLVQSVEDILEELQSLLPPGAARVTEGLAGPGAGRAALDADETAVLACLADGERGVDDLIRLSGLGSSRVSGLLVKLEMKRRVRMLPGRMVESI